MYGPVLHANIKELWEVVVVGKDRWAKPWCIGRDFNVISFPAERTYSAMRDFSDVLRAVDGFASCLSWIHLAVENQYIDVID